MVYPRLVWPDDTFEDTETDPPAAIPFPRTDIADPDDDDSPEALEAIESLSLSLGRLRDHIAHLDEDEDDWPPSAA